MENPQFKEIVFYWFAPFLNQPVSLVPYDFSGWKYPKTYTYLLHGAESFLRS